MDQSVNSAIHVEQEQLQNYGTIPEQLQNKESTLTVDVRLLDQFCRLCLRQHPNLVPLLSRIRNMTVPEVFRAVTGLEMSLEDKYPLKMCRTCLAMLDYAYDICQNFAESYRILATFLLSTTQPLINNLCDYQSGARAIGETQAERMLRKYQELANQRETVDQHEAVPDSTPYIIIPKQLDEPFELPDKIKQEQELQIPAKTADPQVTAQNLNPCNFPQYQLPVQIKSEPELILEPEGLTDPEPDPATAAIEAITDDTEPSAEILGKIRNVALRNKLDPNECYICNKAFESPKDVQIHLSEHVDMIPYQCSSCTTETGQKFKITSLTLLHRHFRMHVSSVKCPECPHRTRTKCAMQTHMRKNHGHSAPMEYSCDQCGNKYLNKSSLNTHKSSHNAVNKSRHPCAYCNKKFPCRRALLQHEMTHTGEKPYQCDVCSKRFCSRRSLNDHIFKFHTKPEQMDDAPIWTCEFEGCDFSTTNRRKYYDHKANHELKFQCPQCPQRFPGGHKLQRHKFVHTGVKEFSCQQCNESFRNKSSLDEHVAEHNNDRPYACETCGRTFVRKRTLKKHLLTHSA